MTGRALNGTALVVQYHVRQAYDDGEPVPPASVLAARLGVSPSTVQRALSALVAAGRLAADRRTPIGAAVRVPMSSLEQWASRVDLDSAAWRPVLVDLARCSDRFGWVGQKSHRPHSVDDIAGRTRLSRSTVLRALSGLAGQGVIGAHEEYARQAPGAPAVRSANSYQLHAGAQAKDPAREHNEDHPAVHVLQAERLLSVEPVWKGFTAPERRAAVVAVAARLRNGWPYIVLFSRLHRRKDEDGTMRAPYAVFRSRMRKIPVHYGGPVPDPETTAAVPTARPVLDLADRSPECPRCGKPSMWRGLPHQCEEPALPGTEVDRVPLPACRGCGRPVGHADMACKSCGTFQLTTEQRVFA